MQQVKSSHLNKLILDSAGQGILGLDIQGNHTFINLAAAKMLGYEVDELIDKHSHSAWHYKKPDGSPYPKEECPIYKALKDGAIHHIDNEVFWKKDGTNFPVEYTSTPIQEEGKVVGTVVVFNDITERKRTEEKVKLIAAEWQTTFDSITDLVSIHDSNFKLVRVNKAYADVFHKKPEELAGRHCYEVVHKTSCPIDNCPHEKALKTKAGTTSEIFEPSLGVYLEISCSPIFDELGEIAGTIHIAKNITERRKVEEALKESEERYRFITDNTADVVWALDSKLRYTYISPSITRQRGFTAEEAMELNITQVLTPESQDTVLKKLQVEMSPEADGQSRKIRTFTQDMEMYRKDGTTFWTENSVTLMITPAGEFDGLLGISRDITERKQLQQKLEEIATHDYLTGLPNRVLLLDRFTIAAALARRNKARLAVMSLDLDKFKTINDTLGHEAGDQVLKTVGMRLTGITRASDTVARVGGDEFILMMLETNQREDATATAQKILDSFTEPLLIDGHQLHLSTSVGIAIYPEDAEDLETLTKKSDAALYFSKGHGRNQFKFFSDGDVRLGGDHKSTNLI